MVNVSGQRKSNFRLSSIANLLRDLDQLLSFSGLYSWLARAHQQAQWVSNGFYRLPGLLRGTFKALRTLTGT